MHDVIGVDVSSKTGVADGQAEGEAGAARKGTDFEGEVHRLLRGLAERHPRHVLMTRQPTIELQNGEVVRPDFDLTVELPHERSHYFIECQNRETFSKQLLHKIQHVRAKQARKTFAFVYPQELPEEIFRAMEAEGVMLFALKDFECFITKLDEGLGKMTLVERPEELADRAMLSEISSHRPSVYMLHEHLILKPSSRNVPSLPARTAPPPRARSLWRKFADLFR
jgi:hypothetical protein